MSEHDCIKVTAFLDNDSETFSYVVYDSDSKQAVVIDPVLDFDYPSGKTYTQGAQRIIDFIKSQNLSVAWILETHAHADHLSAAPFLKKHLNAPIAIGQHITEVQKLFKQVYHLEKEFLPNGEHFDKLLEDGETFQVGAMAFRVIHTPGHTPADVAYVVNENKVFVGDTLFNPDVGTARCDFPGGSASTLYQSIQRLFTLGKETEVYICHDYPPEGRQHQCKTTIEAQKQSNIHVGGQASEEQFVKWREERDATLSMPRLIIPAIQVNIRAGRLPPAEDDGTVYLKVPLNKL
ncbi:MBL fold metallo-hydrolase [Idiomarina ramblicola]|uniref:MBL fold metallo-hydrolase n=1 Tax=Idiomarina ramblicola TaxID=263724 RepID=A0A432Z5H4_9GAMM|nr:MBL fold metallo-hydrolase [Idiomarina ramblicola]RUO73127.1 MBL fold metallo-hydrolase [Idiomarina ramblicola]